MKKALLLLMGVLMIPTFAQAQTWDGSASSDWNTAANWDTNAVPIQTDYVTIPSTAFNWPQLSSAISVRNIEINAGAQLDVNGYPINVTHYFKTFGTTTDNVTITNSASTTSDIVINIGNGVASNLLDASHLQGTAFTDALIVNNSNLVGFSDGSSASCTFNSDVTYNNSGGGDIVTAYQAENYYGGDLTINVINSAAIVSAFRSGNSTVAGNFTLSNPMGGNAQICYDFYNSTCLISGTVSINYDGKGTGQFQIRGIRNLSSGGGIYLRHLAGTNIIANDTLITDSLYVQVSNAGGSLYIRDNDITGGVFFTDQPNNTGTMELEGNMINGNLRIDKNGTGQFYESHSAADTINGDFTLNINNSGNFVFTSHDEPTVVTGDFTASRTAPGKTNLFFTGGIVGEDFSYTNLQGGDTYLGWSDYDTNISGTVSINFDGQNTSQFKMYRLQNFTSGGGVSLTRIRDDSVIVSDTLMTDSLYVQKYSSVGIGGAWALAIYNNDITGNVFVSDTTSNIRPINIGGNTIDSNLSIIKNGTGSLSVSNNYLSTYGGTDSIGGDFGLTINNSGTVNTSYDSPTLITGDFTVVGTAAAETHLFRIGGSVGGDFSFINLQGGDTYLGSASDDTNISGTVSINYDGQNAAEFQMYRLQNLSGGGGISINHITGDSRIENDSLMTDSLYVQKYGSNGFDELSIFNNHLIGEVVVSDTISNFGGINLGGNTIVGDFTLTTRGGGFIDESNVFPAVSYYMGDATFNHFGPGTLKLSVFSDAHYSKDFTLNSTGNGTVVLNGFVFEGSSDGTIHQAGTEPIVFTDLVVNKTGGAKLILDDPVSISNSVTFTDGNIQNTTGGELIFLRFSSYTGVSDSSKVIGPVTKIGYDAFTFPIGSPSKHIPLGIWAPSNITDQFTAQYVSHNPDADGYDRSSRAAALDVINGGGYFLLSRDVGSSNVMVDLGYNFPPGIISSTSDLRVAHWDGTIWQDEGNSGVSGNNLKGKVTTNAPITTFSPFALASVNNLNTLPDPPTYDNIDNAMALTLDVTCSGNTYGNDGATVEMDEPVGSCWDEDDGVKHSVWFSFTAPQNGEVLITTDIGSPTLTDTQLAVYSANDPADFSTFTQVGCNDDMSTSNLLSEMVLSGLNPGEIYYIQVDGYADATGDFCIEVTTNMAIKDFVFNNFEFYPNPSNHRLYLKAGKQIQRVMVFDMMGREVLTARPNQKEISLALDELSSSLYLMKITINETSRIYRIIKE